MSTHPYNHNPELVAERRLFAENRLAQQIIGVPDCLSDLYKQCIGSVMCRPEWLMLLALNEMLLHLIEQKIGGMLGVRETLFVSPPRLLNAVYQELMGQVMPVIVLVLCESIQTSIFGGSREMGCFMLTSDGGLKIYDSSVIALFGGEKWDMTTFVLCDYMRDRDIPRDLGELKNLEEENTEELFLMVAADHEDILDEMYGEGNF